MSLKNVNLQIPAFGDSFSDDRGVILADETAKQPVKTQHPLFLQMKSLVSVSALVAGLALFSHSAIAQPTISGVFPNGSYQFQYTNKLAFTAVSAAGVANVSVTLTPTTVLGVQGFPQTLTSSSGLTISGSANNENVSAPLNSNTLYSVQIIVTDTSSASTTNSISFDTISPVYTWEAEDWDYTSNGVSGLYIDNPQTNAYSGLASTSGADYHNTSPGSGNANYRPQGLETENAGDVPRLPYVGSGKSDYDVGFNNGENWGNYTRHYPPGQYNVFVRASDGNGPQSNAGDISVAAGTASFVNQNGPYYYSTKSTGWQTYGWYPLINNSNQPAVLTIPNDGTASTLRLTIDGGNCNENFFMLLAINTNAPPVGEGYITNEFPNGVYQFQQTNTFNGSVISPNGIGNIVAEVQGNYLSGGSFSQTLTPSSGLTITGTATDKNVSFPLTTDALYSITFLITDGAGNGSTAGVSFDTINPNYYTWEAEDWDYNGGLFFDNPQTNAYYDLTGEEDIDSVCSGGPSSANAYLRGTPGDNANMNTEPNGDITRLQYLNTTNPISLSPYIDYDVGFTAGGQWGNYTRTYPAGIYNIYVRAANGNGNASANAGSISLVTGGNGTPSQTLSQLGTFSAPATGNWQKYAWCPVLNSGGYPARFVGTNGAQQTLRMTFVNAGCNLNFYMLVPANLANNPPPFVNGFTPDSSAMFQPSNEVSFIANSSVGLATNDVVLYLNGIKQSKLSFSGTPFAYNVTCPIQTNQFYTAVITLTDSVGTTSYTNSFGDYSALDYQFEAEDYDYTSNGVSGLFFDNPQVNAYASLGSTANIDNYQGDLSAQPFDYRPDNDPGAAPATTPSGDLSRSQFVPGTTDYNIGFFGNGSWANYTRHYPAGVYNVIGRFACGATGGSAPALSILTSGFGTTSQATNHVGTFSVPDNGWSSWGWVPLLGANGNLAQVTLTGSQTTLQIEGGGDNEANINFYMLVPANTNVPSITGVYPNGATLLQYSSSLSFAVNSSLGVATNSIVVTVNGTVVSNLVFTATATGWNVSYPGLQVNASDTVNIQVTDTSGNVATSTVSFNNYNPADYQWEAEDYDFTSNGIPGQFFDNPQVDAYAGLGSTAGIDNHQADLGANPFNYRPDNDPGAAPATTPSGDGSRSQFGAGTTDYNIGFFGGGSWANYTRHYPLGTYNVLGRFAEGATGGSSATLAIVTSGYGTTNQVTSELGSFSIPEEGWSTWEFALLTDAAGKPASVTFDGTKTTLQLQGGGPNEANVNFFMLVPTTPLPPIHTAISGNSIHLSFVTQTGYNYQVEYKNNLTDASWTPLGSSLTGNNTVQTVSDPLSASHRFYIVQIQP
jgi:hypothetical protein